MGEVQDDMSSASVAQGMGTIMSRTMPEVPSQLNIHRWRPVPGTGWRMISVLVARPQEATSQGDATAKIRSAFHMKMACGAIASQGALRILQGLD